MLWAVLASLVTAPAGNCRNSRADRASGCVMGGSQVYVDAGYNPAGFAFAQASNGGRGMGVECAGTTPTTADGGSITFTRGSVATCAKGDGTIVKLTSNQPAVQPATCGLTQLGVVIEAPATNRLLRSEEFDNAAWDKTGIVVADAYTSPDGTADAESLEDDNASGTEGVCQTILMDNQRQYAFSVFLRSGTATSAHLTITGTGNSAGDVSLDIASIPACVANCDAYGSTWFRYGKVSGAYGAALTAITACVNVGTIAGTATVGTIGVWGAQTESEAAWATTAQHATSYIPTTTAAVTRAAAVLTAATPANITDTVGCIGLTAYFRRWDGTSILSGTWFSFAGGLTFDDGSATLARLGGGGGNLNSNTLANILNRNVRALGGWRTSDTSKSNYSDNTAATTAGTFNGTAVHPTIFYMGSSGVSGQFEGWVSDIVLDITRDGCQ